MKNEAPHEKTLSPQALEGALNWRCAVKQYDPAGRIPAEKWEALKKALHLSPSSYGLQAWKFFVIEDPEVRAKLKEASWGQSQITEADKLVVFAVRKDAGPRDVDRLIERIAQVRGVPLDSLESYRQMILRPMTLEAEKVEAWLTRQVYIALGVFLTSAAALGVDATPMEGFDPPAYDRILGLPEKGWKAVVVAAAGVRSASDSYAKEPKIRFPMSEVVDRI